MSRPTELRRTLLRLSAWTTLAHTAQSTGTALGLVAPALLGGCQSRDPSAPSTEPNGKKLPPAKAEAQQLPAFTEHRADYWVNSEPLKTEMLRGKVLLVDVWTFACWNCYRSFPFVRSLEKKLEGPKFQVIGIHAPEFDHEKSVEAVREHVAKHDLGHPVMLDNDHRYWRALGNRYWPTFYAIDKQLRVRASFVGETHVGDDQADEIEETLRALIDEA